MEGAMQGPPGMPMPRLMPGPVPGKAPCGPIG
eukprot:CAMPEP_0175607030 /NCGR_PEP_ID=MMETSP0096-20121207/61021_1 /TAXON_ID=311494 /ORGANISM="Alexandrium monilatum, Strain CCMP3105" /LENGTH=31 /DNA_ID= /DNA_START= /DNA_END= /DNA_ORIENTATION=